MTRSDLTEVADYAGQARDFLAVSREYLANGDLHQASEKGWGAAAHMAKAVAAAQGWQYETYADFSVVLNRAFETTGEDHLLELRGVANELHSNYYRRKRHLNARVIGREIESMAELLEILAPLANSSDQA